MRSRKGERESMGEKKRKYKNEIYKKNLNIAVPSVNPSVTMGDTLRTS